MAVTPEMVEAKQRELEIRKLYQTNFELEVLLGWLDSRLLHNANAPHSSKVVKEMGTLLYDVSLKIQDRTVREKREKEIEEKRQAQEMKDIVHETHDAQYVVGREKTSDIYFLLIGVEHVVRDVASDSLFSTQHLSLAAKMALEGRPMVTEAALKGTPDERSIPRYVGVAHLFAAVHDIEDQLKRQSPETSLRGYVQIPLPKSEAGRDHLETGIILVSRDIDRRRVSQGPQN